MDYKKIMDSLFKENFELEKQRDQYKTERDTLNSKLNQSYEDNYKLEGQLHDMTKQRDTLIDDIAVLKANISRLERENHDFKKRNALLMNTVDDLDKENKALRLQSDTHFEQWQQHKALNNEISEHIGNKPSSSTYKYFRAKLDELGIKEGE